MSCIEQRVRFGILVQTGVFMSHVLKSELLSAMKDCLRDLENVDLNSPGDFEVIDQKRVLRHQIDALEKDDSDAFDSAA